MSTQNARPAVVPAISGPLPHILIIRAPYYQEVVDGLTQGAKRILGEARVTSEILDISGAYELPQAIRLAVKGIQKFDGYVALGCIIRGETDHYEFICQSTMDGIMNVSLQFGLCVGTGLLTCDNLGQAEARWGQDGHNKGAEAAMAALLQINAARRFGTA